MIRYRVLLVLLLSFGAWFSVLKAYAQTGYENIIQINGVVMTADSLRAVPGATILVRNKNRGVESENSGVFSLVCYKGDTLDFSSVGYRN
jgi:hypothetical protein